MSAPTDHSPADEMAMAATGLAEAWAILPISPRVSAREAYLAMLHAAHARIAGAGRKVPTTHKGVSVVIGELYRGSDFDAQALLSEVESWKLVADYGRRPVPSAAEAEAAIGQAERFIARLARDIPPERLVGTADPADVDALRGMEGRRPPS